jgi:hypothetical protein
MDWNSLSPAQRTSLADILASSCSLTDIDRAIGRSFNAGDSLDALTVKRYELPEKQRFRAQVGELVSRAQETGRLSPFVGKLREIKIGFAAFRNLSDLMTVAGSKVSLSGTPGFEFQSAANELGIVDFEAFLKRMAEIKEATCRFTRPDPRGGDKRISLGTGVLVGDDLVLTNHVLREYIRPDFSGRNALPPATLACEFDYTGTGPAKSVALAGDENWLVGLSPPDDEAPAGGAGAISPDSLDYALVRLATRAPLAGGRPREFERPLNVASVGNGLPVMVVHYPGQDPLSVSFGKTVDMNPNAPRVHYDADTDNGTSGSGVYRLPDCVLICLHQGADRAAGYNQGIPIGLILAHRKRSMA